MTSQLTYRTTSFSCQNKLENTSAFHSSFSGKEKDSETRYHYFGARYYNSDLSLWLSVDPMSNKYPSLSPYNYCAWHPLKLVDPDGKWPRKGVNIYSFSASAGIGVAYGFDAGWKYGIATDYKGMSHFSAVSTMRITNQNLYVGSQNPELEAGFNVGLSLGYERNHSYNTFFDAMQSSSTEVSIEGKGVVGGSIGLGDDSFSGSIGVGLSVKISTEQYKIKQSISVSKKEAKKIGYMKNWSVENVKKHSEYGIKPYYTGTINDTDVQVKCNAVIDGKTTKPSNIWVSEDYLK